jgi:hypothetical protein
MVTRGLFFSGMLTVAAILAAIPAAASRDEQHEASSGKPTRIFSFFSCTNHHPYQGAAFVEHGTVTYKDVVGNRCGSVAEPAREVWYTSPPGFTGEDTVTFPFSGGSTIIHVTVH